MLNLFVLLEDDWFRAFVRIELGLIVCLVSRSLSFALLLKLLLLCLFRLCCFWMLIRFLVVEFYCLFYVRWGWDCAECHNADSMTARCFTAIYMTGCPSLLLWTLTFALCRPLILLSPSPVHGGNLSFTNPTSTTPAGHSDRKQNKYNYELKKKKCDFLK